ncbi:MAG TPA: pyridoxal-phosphate dependent enzyme [Flavisolibacter sp.]|nr:pyridoxal-phosphate dependent enzyme [Flavisolibacter sp.]
MSIPFQNGRIDHLAGPPFLPVSVDVLRLDLVHPVVSGNKWFKLKRYLQEAEQQSRKTLLTFGGAYSNHIVATAAAAQMHGLKSIGIIRGEEPAAWSHTLQAAKGFGMELFFVSREDYRQKRIPHEVFFHHKQKDVYVIAEGGYGEKGAEGAAEILKGFDTTSYSHIVTAVGTGTTLAGLVNASQPHQQVIGIPVLKGAHSLQQEIESLLPEEKKAAFQLLHDYHFGGYAKHSPELLHFMNEAFQQYLLPTDFVYTAKALFAVFDLAKKEFFQPSEKVLFVHTGGLQGNASLPKGTLIFGT